MPKINPYFLDVTECQSPLLLDFVRQTRFERLGTFAYSHEEDAYNDKHYTDNVPADIKQERADTIMELQESTALSINKQKVGQTLKIIIDREDADYYIGRTEFDSPKWTAKC